MNEPAWIRQRAPRFKDLVVCIRAALYGASQNHVQHMVQRNVAIDSERALEAQFSTQEKAA